MKTYTKIIFTMLMVFIINIQVSAQNIGDLNGINYQAVAIDENGKEIVGMDIKGKPLYEKEIGVRFSILKGEAGDIQYQETHTTLTDQYGLFSLTIGHGNQTGLGQYSDLLSIPWIDADQWLKVEIAIHNDGNFRLVSLQQFMTVPYSFYTDDIADDAITTHKILDYTILNEDISEGAIDTRTILNETLLNEDVSTGAIDTRTILDETLLNEDVSTGAIDTRTILDETLLNEDVSTGAIDTRTILDETLLNEDVSTGAIDTRTILDETLLNEDVSTGAIDTRTILDETLLNEDVSTGAIDTRTILDETLLNEDVSTGAIDTRTILDETLLNEDVSTGAIDTRTILDETILNEDVSTAAIDSRTILNGTVLNEDIADGTVDLQTKITNVLGVQNGGTGINAVNPGDILIGNGTDGLNSVPITDSVMVFSNKTGTTEVYKLRAGLRASMEIDEATKTIYIHAVEQAGGPETGGGTVSTGAIAPGSQQERNFPADVQVGDIVLVTANTDLQGLTMTAYVRQAGQVNVVLFNGTGNTINLGSVTFKLANFGQ